MAYSTTSVFSNRDLTGFGEPEPEGAPSTTEQCNPKICGRHDRKPNRSYPVKAVHLDRGDSAHCELAMKQDGMSREGYKREHIIKMFREAEVALAGGQTQGEVCRSLRISEQSHDRRRSV